MGNTTSFSPSNAKRKCQRNCLLEKTRGFQINCWVAAGSSHLPRHPTARWCLPRSWNFPFPSLPGPAEHREAQRHPAAPPAATKKCQEKQTWEIPSGKASKWTVHCVPISLLRLVRQTHTMRGVARAVPNHPSVTTTPPNPDPITAHSLRSPRVQTHNPSTSPFSPTPRIGWVESRPQGRSWLIRAHKNQLSAAPESGADLQLPLKPSRVTASAVFPAGFMDATIKAPKPACSAFYGRSI